MIHKTPTDKEIIVSGNDSVVIRKYISGIPGGRTLDVEGFPGTNIFAGHVIIRRSDGTYAPLSAHDAKAAEGADPAVEAGYDNIPEGATYAGVLYRTVSVKNPTASIMYDGVVNSALLPYPVPAAFKTACPHIIFEKDEEA